MRPVLVTVGPLAAADADGICQSQTPSGAGALTLNGALVSSGVATILPAARVTITAAANESARTFTIEGTDWAGSFISETLAGPNATTATSVLDYATVTAVRISAAAAGAITVGNAAVAGSPWVRSDDYSPAPTSVQVVVTGTVNYTVQVTRDDPNSVSNPLARADVAWSDAPDSALVGATATRFSNLTAPGAFLRVVLNSGSGSARMIVTQFSAPPR